MFKLQRKTHFLFACTTTFVLILLQTKSCLANHDKAADSSNSPRASDSQVAQRRVGGLEPGDYIDEAGELEVMANQQQIPTAHLMAAAGHVVPENFFLPGGSVPAPLYSRYQPQYQHHHHHQQQQQQQQQQPEAIQPMSSHVQARFLAPHHLLQQQQQQGSSHNQQRHYLRQADLLAAASTAAEQQQQQQDVGPLIDFNSYNLIAQAGEGRDGSAQGAMVQGDYNDFIRDPANQAGPAQIEQQAGVQQQLNYVEQQLIAELTTLANHQHQREQQRHLQEQQDNSVQASENSPEQFVSAASGANIGPAYQISQAQESAINYGGPSHSGNKEMSQRPFGLPTKSSDKEPSGMLKPLGNPKTISSPLIDFVTQQLPKTSALEKFNDKLPQTQTPTVFSFSSSKDPMEKVKGVNQKKRNVMKQAEQMVRMLVKSINDKFGTNIGDQTDIPFLLSSIGPLGMAQNLLSDPTLFVTLLNTAEKTYFSDILPAPAKMAIRPVLNIFRMPNKKRDKANLSNIISFLASGGQIHSSTPKHRQGTGIEKSAKTKGAR